MRLLLLKANPGFCLMERGFARVTSLGPGSQLLAVGRQHDRSAGYANQYLLVVNAGDIVCLHNPKLGNSLDAGQVLEFEKSGDRLRWAEGCDQYKQGLIARGQQSL